MQRIFLAKVKSMTRIYFLINGMQRKESNFRSHKDLMGLEIKLPMQTNSHINIKLFISKVQKNEYMPKKLDFITPTTMKVLEFFFQQSYGKVSRKRSYEKS